MIQDNIKERYEVAIANRGDKEYKFKGMNFDIKFVFHEKENKNETYIKIKKIEGAKRHTWVNKNRKPDKLYRYKVASYKKKKKSKKSYEVSAMSYGRDARTVNAGYVDFGIEDEDMNNFLELGICYERKMHANIDGDENVKY